MVINVCLSDSKSVAYFFEFGQFPWLIFSGLFFRGLFFRIRSISVENIEMGHAMEHLGIIHGYGPKLWTIAYGIIPI